MTDEERFDPADELRRDIEAAIEGQHPKEPEPEPAAEPEPEPKEAAADTAEPRKRDEKGRFVAEEGTEPAAEPAEPSKDAKVEPAPTDAPKMDIRPPPGFSVASKAIWDDLPECVRADIEKRNQEIDAGLKRYSGLGKFAEEAERNGTTLKSAVADYVAVETALRQNPVGGVEFICQRMGIDPRQLAQVMFQRYNQPQAAQASQAGEAPPQPSFDPEALARQFQQIARAEAEARVQAMKAETQRAQLDSEIAAFGADPKNKFFANLRPVMAKLVAADESLTLQTAYDAACWLNPEIRAILINETNGGRNKEAAAAATRSRNAAKAVGGSPTPGVNPDQSGKRQNLSLDEEIRAAVDAQVGAA
jgi:hypothetical protein